MWLHFDRSGRYAGRSQRLTLGEIGCLPLLLLFFLMLALLPFLWPLAVFGGGLAGWSATIAWNLLLGAVFLLVLGRPPRKRREPEPPVTPTITAGPRDWAQPDWYNDGRRMV